MFQPMSRALLRSTPPLRTPIHRSFSGSSRRYASSAPVDRPRSWKSSATRWGVVIAGLYYYNTGKMFAEGPASVVQLPQTDRETEIMPTVDDLATQRRQQALARQSTSTSTGTSNQAATAVATTGATSSAGSPQDLEEEAEGEGAFNPETGEINWDCPCLGGMANGPCGEQFKAAFSCFVYSKEEPKGMDCIENFKNMQDCFRQYPEVYGAELADEEDEEEEQPAQKSLSSGQPALEAGAEREGAASSSQSIAPALPKDPEPPKVIEQTPGTPTLRPEEIQQKRQRAKSAAQQVKSEHPITDETEEAVPKAWHDTRSSHDAK